ncbi:hypothetical protein ACJX0J_017455, partial [Zea mays]
PMLNLLSINEITIHQIKIYIGRALDSLPAVVYVAEIQMIEFALIIIYHFRDIHLYPLGNWYHTDFHGTKCCFGKHQKLPPHIDG